MGLPLARKTYVELCYAAYCLIKRNKWEEKQSPLVVIFLVFQVFGGEVWGGGINPAEWRMKHHSLSPLV